jgi:hypothetical protein
MLARNRRSEGVEAMSYRKQLIESSLPLKAVNEAFGRQNPTLDGHLNPPEPEFGATSVSDDPASVPCLSEDRG